MQAVEPTAAEVRDALARVLARPEFQLPDRPRLLVWLSELREWIRSLLLELIRRLDPDVAVPAVVWALRGVLVLAAIFLMIRLVRIIRRHGWAGRQSREDAPTDVNSEPERGIDWAALADVAAAEGRFREAVLALYQGVIHRLEASGVLRYDASKTPGDYRREIRSHPRLSRNLSRFLALFEPVAFGGREPDRSAFDRLRAAALEAARE